MTLGVSKIWQWISFVLIGFAAGIIVTIKYIAEPGQKFHIEFKKVKQKIRGRGNVADHDVVVPVTIDANTKDKKTLRQERRAARKAKKNDATRNNR